MARLTLDFFSNTLGMMTSLQALIPEKYRPAECSTLLLLHGWSDDETVWLRRTSLERYCEGRPLVVIMPRGGLSFYQDTISGMRYWEHISAEVPALARRWLGVDSARGRNFAAGLSMGGYGALRLGLQFPGSYAAVASLSGACDLAFAAIRIRAESPEAKAKIDAIFGLNRAAPQDVDLFQLASRLARDGGPFPRVYQSCGVEDFLYEDNIKFREHLAQLNWPEHTYSEFPGGHTWEVWDREILRVLDWLGF